MPLSQLMHYMNKYSNNVMTRNLLLTLGAERYGAPGTLGKGRRAIQEWLAGHGMKASDLFLDNGSGLSRRGRVSARTLGRMLLLAHESDFMPEFVASLPLAALDGTLRRRFRETDLGGKLHMKTGLLNDVRSIAGYMRNRKGQTLVVVMLHNHPGVEQFIGTKVQDALLEWLFEQ